MILATDEPRFVINVGITVISDIVLPTVLLPAALLFIDALS